MLKLRILTVSFIDILQILSSHICQTIYRGDRCSQTVLHTILRKKARNMQRDFAIHTAKPRGKLSDFLFRIGSLRDNQGRNLHMPLGRR